MSRLAPTLYVFVLASSLAACSSGGGESNPPPPPPAFGPTIPLAISADNGEAVLKEAVGFSEAVYGIAVFAGNHLAALANTSGNSSPISCSDGGGSTATNNDEDGSQSPTPGDTITATTSGPCEDEVLPGTATGTLNLELTDIYVGTSGEARFDGKLLLSPAYQYEVTASDGRLLDTEIESDISFSIAMRGSIVQAIRLTLEDGEDLVITVGTNLADPMTEAVTGLNFLRRVLYAESGATISKTAFSFDLQSEILAGSVSCGNTTDFEGRVFFTPLSGRVECLGVNNSAVALSSDRLSADDPVTIEVDEDGDGLFQPLQTTSLPIWDDFIDGPLFEAHIDHVNSDGNPRAVETVPAHSIVAAVDDIVYEPVYDRVYISNPNGIVEIDPASLDVIRSVSVADSPGALAVSDDGSTLWFGLRDIDQAGRISLPSMQLSNRIDLGDSPGGAPGMRRVFDILVAPGSTSNIVVSAVPGLEVIAYANGTALPEMANDAWHMVFTDARTIIGINVTYNLIYSYDSVNGVTELDKIRDLLNGQQKPPQVGTDDIWEFRGLSANLVQRTRTGRINGSVERFPELYDYILISPSDGLLYAIDSREPIIEIFDESTRVRLGAYVIDDPDYNVYGADLAVITDDEVIFVSGSRLVRISKSNLQPNIAPVSCRPVSVGGLLVEGTHLSLTCLLRDMVYDSQRDLIYAALPGAIGPQGNSIAVIDPLTFEVESFIPLQTEPNSIAISDDSAVLTVTFLDATRIAEIDLSSRTVTRITELGFEPDSGAIAGRPLEALAARARPGVPGEVIVGTNRYDAFLYKDGQRQPDGVSLFGDYIGFFFDSFDSSRVTAYEPDNIASLLLNGSGLQDLGTTEDVLVRGGIARSGNKLLDTRGTELDIASITGSVVCDFTGIPFKHSSVAYSLDANFAYFVYTTQGYHEISRCEFSTGEVIPMSYVTRFVDPDGNSKIRLQQITGGDLLLLHDSTLVKISAPD